MIVNIHKRSISQKISKMVELIGCQDLIHLLLPGSLAGASFQRSVVISKHIMNRKKAISNKIFNLMKPYENALEWRY